MRFAVAGELMRQRSELSLASVFLTKGHRVVHLLKVVFWGLGERCEGGMAETLRESDRVAKPWE